METKDCHTKITYLELEVEQLKIINEGKDVEIKAINNKLKQIEPVVIVASHKNVWNVISILLALTAIILQLLMPK